MGDKEGNQEHRYPEIDHGVAAKDLWPVNEIRYWLRPDLRSIVS